MKAVVSMRAIFVVLALGLGSASAQSLSDSDGPAELPPSGFTGTQYVDSNGCLFVRAGLNGDVTWIPRVNRNRELLCGFEPTIGQSQPVRPVTVVQAQAPKTATKARTQVQETAPAVRQLVAQPPSVSIKLPKGFKAAWTDGRLNPHRGPRTALGDAQMARLWTKTVPATLIKPVATVTERGVTTVSTKSVKTIVTGDVYVQIGIFRDPSNAQRVVAHVQSAGLPVGVIKKLRRDVVAQTVLAGPFAGQQEARNGLVKIRRAGFADAFIR
ncbi:MAG: SPOR domain-containing protein [Paracoccaceae bacterium]